MSGDVGAEVAAVVDEAMAEHMRGHAISNSPNYFTCDSDCRVRAIARALAPLIAVRVEAAKAEALREAASDIVADCSNQPGPCICTARHWLRDRAAALDPGPRP